MSALIANREARHRVELDDCNQQIATERARAEALGAELMRRWEAHAESCMVCVPSLCDTDNVCRSWRPVFGLLQPAARAAESAGGA